MIYNEEIRNRILIAAYAYAYEVLEDPLVDDATFDALAIKIDVSKPTGNRKLDNFFKKYYSPHTGMWIYNHPGYKEGSIQRIIGILRKKNMES